MFDLSQILRQFSDLDIRHLADLPPETIIIVIFFGTFVTEDGACLAAGALASQGIISLPTAIATCFAGILVGDVGLYWIGRIFGSSLEKTRVFSRFVGSQRMDRAARWLNRRGAAAIFLSRFMTGLRLPTYLAAGFLRTSFTRFFIYFVIAVAIWTPLLVAFSSFAQKYIFQQNFLLGIILLFVLIKAAFVVSSYKRRRLFWGRLKRLFIWEFWPLQVFYIPVAIYAGLLAVRHRSLTVFTCANPAIPAGGFIRESKNEIYNGLRASSGARDFLLAHTKVPAGRSSGDVEEILHEMRSSGDLDLPLVLKPDSGERGKGVRVIRTEAELASALEGAEEDMLIQELAEGAEFSVFYYRLPSESRGRIFSITRKVFPEVVGDGESTVERLILGDSRAVCMARAYFEQLGKKREYVPDDGESFRLIEIGTHSKGAIFLDGGELATKKLEERIDAICRGYEGFYFGRFDLRAESTELFREGLGFRIVELNGVTSESTNIYDPSFSLVDAYRTLFRQWRIAYRIGRENYERGVRKSTVTGLLRLLAGRPMHNA